MKFAMCNEFCEGWSFDDACRLAADAGYDGIEIAPFTLSDSVEDIAPAERQHLRATAAGHGLEVVGLHWLLAKPEGLHLNSPDPAVRRRTVDYLASEIDFCADLGGSRMIVGSPKQRNVPEHETYDQVWERAVAVFGELAGRAQERRVVLCIEPLTTLETDFITAASDARRLVQAVNQPAFRMMLDVKAMSGDTDGEPMPEIIRKSAEWLAHFHANDANLQGPGFGDVDFRPIAAALRDVGYDGYVSVEVFDFSAGPDRIARESLDYLRTAFA